MVFWVMTLYSDMVGYEGFGGQCCLLLQYEVWALVSYTSQHGVTTQKTTIRVFIAVKTSYIAPAHYKMSFSTFIISSFYAAVN